MTFRDYSAEFARLLVNKSGSRVAPHKAIMLITVMDMIGEGEIDTSFIPVTVAIERRFNANWRRLVPDNSGNNCNMAYPFFHLASSSFWKLVKLPDAKKCKECSSVNSLKKNFAGAVITEDLFRILKNPYYRAQLRLLLIDSYIHPSKTSIAASDLLSLAILASILIA